MSAPAIHLYDRTEALAIVEDWLWESGGELTPEIEALLAEAEGDFAEKAERVALKVRELELTAEANAAEAARLQDRAAVRTKSAKSLKEYLRLQMMLAERPKIDGRLVTIRVQNSPPAARCGVDPATLPETLRRVVPERVEFDGKAAIAAWKAGMVLPEGVRVEQSTHLRIV